MDKTIEIVMVATVALVAAAILIFLVQGKSGDFTDTLDGIISGGKCTKAKSDVKSGKSVSEINTEDLSQDCVQELRSIESGGEGDGGGGDTDAGDDESPPSDGGNDGGDETDDGG